VQCIAVEWTQTMSRRSREAQLEDFERVLAGTQKILLAQLATQLAIGRPAKFSSRSPKMA
jgi:hypothetical protein